MRIRRVAEGAYFVASYSKQTIIPSQRTVTNQAVTLEVEEEELPDVLTVAEEPVDYLTAEDDPVLAKLWDNDDDAIFDTM